MSRNSKQHVAMPSFQSNDPDQLFVCPFDPVHRVTAMRLPYHIRKCSRQYPCSNMVTCPFNARHVVQASDIEKHIEECPDRQSIAQDFQEGHGYAAGNLEVPEVNFEISNEESWDDDVDENVGPRGINFVQVDGDAFDELRGLRQVQQRQSEVLSQPSHVDLSGMSAAARKNYKRAQKRKEQQAAAAAENGTAEEYFEDVQEQMPEEDPVVAEQRRQEEEKSRLEAISREYLGDGKQSGSFVDYKSILNIYCQKKKINAPVFREAPGPTSRFGSAFGAECIVKTDVFRSKIIAKRKKDALQDAAKQALLGLNIDIGPDPTPCRPAHMRTEEEMRRIRELDELNRAEPPLHQPRLNHMPIPGMSRDQLANQMGRMNIHQQQMGLAGVGRGRGAALAAANAAPAAQAQASGTGSVAACQQNGDDDWTVVSGKKGKKTENPVFQHSLNMAGRGRGRMN